MRIYVCYPCPTVFLLEICTANKSNGHSLSSPSSFCIAPQVVIWSSEIFSFPSQQGGMEGTLSWGFVCIDQIDATHGRVAAEFCERHFHRWHSQRWGLGIVRLQVLS